MLWLDLLLLTEAAAELVLSCLLCAYFACYATAPQRTARKVACLTLSLVNGGLALEAGAYVALSSQAAGLERLAAALVRTALLAGVSLMALLVWRQGAYRP